jgi:nitrogen fixation/metabolism regulation signal transduction histidine kinase
MILNKRLRQLSWKNFPLILKLIWLTTALAITAVAIGLSTEAHQDTLAAVRNRGLLIATVAVSVCFLLAFWVGKSITSPLKSLIRATERIARGNLTERVGLSEG